MHAGSCRLLNRIKLILPSRKLSVAVILYNSLASSQQNNPAGARGSHWGWDDEDEDDMGEVALPEIEYKVSSKPH